MLRSWWRWRPAPARGMFFFFFLIFALMTGESSDQNSQEGLHLKRSSNYVERKICLHRGRFIIINSFFLFCTVQLHFTFSLTDSMQIRVSSSFTNRMESLNQSINQFINQHVSEREDVSYPSTGWLRHSCFMAVLLISSKSCSA